MAELVPVDIPGVEVLAAGTWDASTGEVTITEADLDALEAAYRETETLLEAPVRLGHTEQQKVLWGDGMPRAGVVRNLRRVGSKLVADLKAVPGKIAALLKAGSYGPRSAGLSRNFKVGEKTYPLVLTHLALLGDQLPAVAGLNAIESCFAGASEGETEWVAYDRTFVQVDAVELEREEREDDDEPMAPGAVREGAPPAAESEEEEDEMALEKALRAELGLEDDADIMEAVKALKSAGESTSLARDEELSALRTKVEELELTGAKAKAEALVLEFSKRITPAMRDACLKQAQADPVAAREFFSTLPVYADSVELGSANEGDGDSEVELTKDEIAAAKAMNVPLDHLIEGKKLLLARERASV